MHRIEIEEIADHDLRTQVAQDLSAVVFISHHRSNRFASYQKQFGDGAAYSANAAGRASDQNRICHVASSESFAKSKVPICCMRPSALRSEIMPQRRPVRSRP